MDISRNALYQLVGKDEYHLHYAHLTAEQRIAQLTNQPIRSQKECVAMQQNKLDKETQEAKRYDRINAQRKRRKVQNDMDLTAVVESLFVIEDGVEVEISLPVKGIKIA